MKSKVRVRVQQFGGHAGYDVQVADREATVGDYLTALQRALAGYCFYRSRNPGGCRGCDLCCADRAPLTILDGNLFRHTGWNKVESREREEAGAVLQWVGQYAWITVTGQAVDITLQRDEDGKCLFLDRVTRLCRVYPYRPLVCRTFICSPRSRRAARLHEAVINAAEDALVRYLLLAARSRGSAFPVHEAVNPAIDIRDWLPRRAYCQGNFLATPLVEICPPPVVGAVAERSSCYLNG